MNLTLSEYLDTLTVKERRAFAQRAKTTDGYLAQLKGHFRSPSPALARRLAAASEGQIALSKLRPDVWSPKAA
jgi:DNA-binding transcriptional regulator YdaS (Cro superfamily)